MILSGAVAAALSWAAPAGADYQTHPDLRPENRCAEIAPELDGEGNVIDAGGAESLHCQRLFWDLPAAVAVGLQAIGAPFAQDRIPRFPNGLTDRIPPLYTDGVEGYETWEPGRRALCPLLDENGNELIDANVADPRDPGLVSWWSPVIEEGTLEAKIATASDASDFPNTPGDERDLRSVADPASPQTGPLYEVACRRGTRSSIGPWQTGTDPAVYDRIGYSVVRFEGTERLDQDVENGLIDPRHPSEGGDGTGRREWNTGSEFYNHFGSHHGTCWNPETAITSGALQPSYTCNDPDDPWTASDAGEPGNRSGECGAYQAKADPGDRCYAAGPDPRCSSGPADGQMFRNATQYPGRLYVEFPEGRGVVSLENQLWECDHHVVTQLPPGSYSMTRLADYRKQTKGVLNTTGDTVHGAAPGDSFGGTVGEMVIQYFTEPFTDPNVKPINVAFEIIQDLATTAYPPFTWNVHELVWHAPFDLAVGLITIHSHHRNVKGYVDVLPGNPPRLESSDADCGGAREGTMPLSIYTNWDWEDARVCEYWRQPDGPLVLRKGQALKTTCYVNNGVTPEAIKRGLVAGAALEAFRNQGAPIPLESSTVPTSMWSGLLIDSPLGQEFLYGTHPPVNYRVKYSCGPAPGFSFDRPLNDGAGVCNPNPAVDDDGDYIDGPYRNDTQCGGGWCNPSTIVFANVGEDEMCIPVFMYWRLDDLVSEDGSANEEAVERLSGGDAEAVNDYGTPGAVQKSPGDIGDCRECTAAGW